MESRTPVHETKTEFKNALHYHNIEGLTIQKLFHSNAAKLANKRHLGSRPFDAKTQKYGDYQYLTYSEVEEMVKFVGSGLCGIGLKPKDKLGIMSKNNLPWGLTDYASACYGFVLVPVYDSLPQTDCEYIISHSEMRAIVISSKHCEFIQRIRNSISTKIEFVIVIDDDQSKDAIFDGATHSFSQLISIGKQNVVRENEALPNDLYTVVYTSGTTGVPKGAMLSQNNVASSVMMASCFVHPDFDNDDEQEVSPSFLPLAHIFGRVLDITVATWGGRIAYFSGNISMLTDDFRNAKITILPGVPRVFIRTYNLITTQIASSPWYKRWIFNTAFYMKQRSMLQHQHEGFNCPPVPAWTDNLVFNRIKETMGGRVRIVVNGGSSLQFKVREYLSVCFGTFIGEGYGMTETGACIAFALPVGFDPGSVGVQAYKCQACLESVPDMDYRVTDSPYPRGELLVRGPQIFKGYYKDPESTAAALDADGWFRTGDVGMWVPGPYKEAGTDAPYESLHIIDRKKNIFKLAQGEFVVADRVEAVLLCGASPYIRQLIVYGPASASALVALVVPEWDVLLDTAHAAKTGSEGWVWKEEGDASASTDKFPRAATPEQVGGEIRTLLAVRHRLTQDKGVRAFLLGEIQRIVESETAEKKKEGKIKRFEIPRGIVVCAEEWTEQNHCMTASQKVKREGVRAAHADAIAIELARMENELRVSGK